MPVKININKQSATFDELLDSSLHATHSIASQYPRQNLAKNEKEIFPDTHYKVKKKASRRSFLTKEYLSEQRGENMQLADLRLDPT